MNGCEITIDANYGSGTWTVSADQVQYINPDTLVNDGYNGTIYLYPAGSLQLARGEYIALPNNLAPRYYSGGSVSNYSYITSVQSVSFNLQSQVMRAQPVLQMGFWFVAVLFMFVKIFSRGS